MSAGGTGAKVELTGKIDPSLIRDLAPARVSDSTSSLAQGALPNADRLPPIPPAEWTDQQRTYAEAIVSGPRGALLSPFVPMLRSPELMDLSQRVGEYLRYRSSLPPRLFELAVLLVARHWSQPVEWAIHAPIALRAGLPEGVIEAIGLGDRPVNLGNDETALYDLCTELHVSQRVADATWAASCTALGERGTVDLIGVCGYYGFLAMLMNAARTPIPIDTLAAPMASLPARRA